MSIRNKARSALLNIATSDGVRNARRSKEELKRKLSGRRHVVTAFLELDDPYSYLLCRYLPELAEHYDIELDVRLTEAVTNEFRPEPALYYEYAMLDCERLARELGVRFLDRNDTPPVEHRRKLLDALAGAASQEGFASDVFDAISAYWRGDSAAVARRIDDAAKTGDGAAMLASNKRELKKLGHYNAAMLHYAGEWYWGVDRLHYLVERLEALGLLQRDSTPPKIASIAAAMQLKLPVRPPAAAKELPAFELFYSFRSPYSWIALSRMQAIVDAFGLRLKVRPLLPMVMRSMQVPRPKLLYIAADSSREARRSNVPFGNFADPIGVGVERCLAVYEYAVTENRARDFLVAAGEAIWAKGIDVATDDGLRKVTGKAGLFWPGAKAALDDEEWRMKAEANRADMMNSGSWGVPTVRIGEFVTWGQDRDWLIARHLEELCDTGEGILV